MKYNANTCQHLQTETFYLDTILAVTRTCYTIRNNTSVINYINVISYKEAFVNMSKVN